MKWNLSFSRKKLFFPWKYFPSNQTQLKKQKTQTTQKKKKRKEYLVLQQSTLKLINQNLSESKQFMLNKKIKSQKGNLQRNMNYKKKYWKWKCKCKWITKPVKTEDEVGRPEFSCRGQARDPRLPFYKMGKESSPFFFWASFFDVKARTSSQKKWKGVEKWVNWNLEGAKRQMASRTREGNARIQREVLHVRKLTWIFSI